MRIDRTRLLGLGPAAVTAAVTGWFLYSGSWRVVGIWPEPAKYAVDAPAHLASFADLAYLTAVAECMAQGVDFTACDPYGRPFQPYGVVPGSILSLLGVGFADTGWLGMVLAVTWVVLVAVLGVSVAARWQGRPALLVGGLVALTAIAISPPALLGIERGQFEVVVIALTGLGLGWITRPTRNVRSAAGALAMFASVVLKYLSMGAFTAFLAPGRFRQWGLIAGAASLGFLLLNLGDLSLARETARADQASTTRVMFSSTTAFVTVLVEDPLAFAAPPEQALNDVLLRVLGALMFVFLVAIWWCFMRRSATWRGTRSIPDVTWNLVVGGGFALTVPFFLGASNDYRLMFLVLPVTGLLFWIGTRDDRALDLWAIVALMVTSALPAASMIPNDSGFIMPEVLVVMGDVALTASLAAIAVIFLGGWRRSLPSAANSDR